jgi:hypothetical protein
MLIVRKNEVGYLHRVLRPSEAACGACIAAHGVRVRSLQR